MPATSEIKFLANFLRTRSQPPGTNAILCRIQIIYPASPLCKYDGNSSASGTNNTLTVNSFQIVTTDSKTPYSSWQIHVLSEGAPQSVRYEPQGGNSHTMNPCVVTAPSLVTGPLYEAGCPIYRRTALDRDRRQPHRPVWLPDNVLCSMEWRVSAPVFPTSSTLRKHSYDFPRAFWPWLVVCIQIFSTGSIQEIIP